MECNPALMTKLYTFVHSRIKAFMENQSPNEVQHGLAVFQALLNHEFQNRLLSTEFEEFDSRTVSLQFQRHHFEPVLESLLENLTLDWSMKCLDGVSRRSFEQLFIGGQEPQVSLLVLCRCVSNNDAGFKVNRAVALLEKFIENKLLDKVLLLQCEPATSDNNTNKQSVISIQRDTWEELVKFIATLPERITSKLQNETNAIFYPDEFFSVVADSIINALFVIQSYLKQEKEMNVQFLSLLVGKLCLSGHADRLWNKLLPSLLKHTERDYVWCRVCERMLRSVPQRSMESVLEPLLARLPWYGYVGKLLGNAVLTNTQVQFLMTNKLLFLRYYKEPRILQNVIGHVSSCSKPLFSQLFTRLLTVWADPLALQHSPYEQHLYVSQALCVCVAFVTPAEVKQLQSVLMSELMSGVQRHLASSSHPVRRLGMVCAEALTRCLQDTQHSLNFDYEEDEEVRLLKSLLTKPSDPGLEQITRDVVDLDIKSAEKEVEGHLKENVEGSNSEGSDESDLDSDDDLEPYDLSNDVKVTKEKPPMYLRDCMDGLINPENPERVEQCLQVAESLVRQHAGAAIEIAAEFSKVLLHLQDNFSLPLFSVWRHKAMVALLVVAPKQVSEYLTGEVYERNYSIMQRLDILQTLADSAKELSSPSTSATEGATQPALVQPLDPSRDSTLNEPEHWRDIVQKRIDSKTRRFGKGPTQVAKEAVANRFAPVAGCFFYPLINTFDRVQGHLDLLGEDHVVLSRLVYTLGVIVYAAQHAPICSKLGQSMLEFLWVIRYHPQPFTRQAVLFNVSMVILAVPAHALVAQFSHHVTELRLWLQDVVEHDSDSESQKMAAQALVLLQNSIKQEFSGKIS